jgi:hypothetical protein
LADIQQWQTPRRGLAEYRSAHLSAEEIQAVNSYRESLTPQMLDYDTFTDRGHTRYLPYLMYFHRADYRSPVVNTDRLGFRISHGANATASVAGERPAGPVRLLAGASTAFGLGATSDRTTLSSLLWSRYAPSAPWLNFAGTVYSTAQEVILFLLHRHLLPEIEEIIILSGFNAVALARLPEWQRGEHGAFFFCGDYYEQMAELRARHQPSGLLGRRPRKATPPIPEAPPPASEAIANAVELTSRHLAGWQQLIAGTGARLTYVFQPLATWLRDEPAPEEKLLFEELDRIAKLGTWEKLYGDVSSMEAGRAYSEALRVACEKQQVNFLDLNPVLREAISGKEWIYVDRAHFTDHGHDVVSRLLAECLNLR